MKRHQRVLSIVLAAVIVASAAACGSNNDSATDSPSTTTAGSSATNAPATDSSGTGDEVSGEEAPEEVSEEPEKMFWDDFEVIDQGGREIVFCANWDGVMGYSTDERPDESLGEGFEDALMNYENRRRIEEKYNITYTSINVPWEDMSAQLATTVLSGKPICDVLFTEDLIALTLNGFLLPTSAYVPPQADALNGAVGVELGIPILGDTYYFKSVDHRSTTGSFLLVNQDIIRSLGVPNPVDLFNEGQWTFDNFLDICKKATVSTDGTGIINQWGLGGTFLWMTEPFIASNGGIRFDLDNLKQGIDNPKTMEALEFVRRLVYEEKVWYYPENWWDWEQTQNAYRDGKVAFSQMYVWMEFGPEMLNYEYSAVPFPKGPSNDGDGSFFVSPNGAVIPVGVSDPQMVYQIYEEMINWFGHESWRMTQDHHYAWVIDKFLTQEDYERILDLGAYGPVPDLAAFIPDYGFLDVFGPITTGEMTVAQAVETHKDRMQAAVDNVFKTAE